ncbi:MAG TPA: riboflavin biosynthesis protein RibF [Paludibacter sp.]|nr:riboflavin biosynthesis protein RibF [Paludibacter sp.]
MKILNQSLVFAENVATVGFFDGVHAGHRFLIDELKAIAKAEKLQSVVFTFSSHPRKVLHSDYQPQLLTTLEEKLNRLESTGIDACVILDFSLEMAKLSAFEFLKNILYEQYNVRTLLVGHDHRFGRDRADGFVDYKKYGAEIGMKVIQTSRYTTTQIGHISSSEVRSALKNGDISRANEILSYPYSFRGKVIDGYKMGRKIGFPTANIEPDDNEKLIPATGVYAVEVRWNNCNYQGMMNIGKRPTMENGTSISIEVHIFKFNHNIYNQTIEIIFKEKIRDEQKFQNLDALIHQLNRDKLKVMEIFKIS